MNEIQSTNCCEDCTNQQLEQIENVIDLYQAKESNLIQILHASHNN